MKFFSLFVLIFIAVSTYPLKTSGIERTSETISSRCVASPEDITEAHVTPFPNLILPDAYCCNETTARAECLENKISTMEKLNSFVRADIVLKLQTIYLEVCPTSSLGGFGEDSCDVAATREETDAEKIGRLEEGLACLISGYRRLIDRGFTGRMDEMSSCLDRKEECEMIKLDIRKEYIDALIREFADEQTCYEEGLSSMTEYANELNRIITSFAGGPASCHWWDFTCLTRQMTVIIPPMPAHRTCSNPLPIMRFDLRECF